MKARIFLCMFVTTLVSILSQDFNNYSACPSECSCYLSHTSSGSIVDVYCEISEFQTFDFSRLETNVTSILHLTCLFDSGITLREGTFNKLYTFVGFFTTYCQIEAIEEHGLKGLHGLQELVIDGAKSIIVHDNAFLHTRGLVRLTITNSGLSKFPPLFGLEYIQFVNFTNNVIEEFSNSAFYRSNEVFKDLYIFVLNQNLLEDLNVSLYQKMPNLKYASFEGNRISFVSTDCFHQLTDLEYLDLTENNIKFLSANLFKDNVNLMVLGLGPNPLQAINKDLFMNAVLLQVLVMSSTKVGDAIWEHLPILKNLHELQLSNCSISRINETSLNSLNLTYLDLSENGIKYIPNNAFIKQEYLTHLNVSCNGITNIEPRGFRGLSRLSSLDLKNNNLLEIDTDVFVPCQELSLLNISYNMLRHFPNLNHQSKLYVLDLRSNRIAKLTDTSLTGLYQLAGINLSKNRLAYIPKGIFQQGFNLQLLDLSKNNMKIIEAKAFSGMENLKWLFLDHNDLYSIVDVFINMSSLLQLDLSHNKIHGMIKGEFFIYTRSLQQIFMAHNQISGIYQTAFGLFYNLEIVDLRYNKISKLQPNNIKFSELVRPPPKFYFSGNRFNCDCDLAWLKTCVDKWFGWCIGLEAHELERITCSSGYKIKVWALLKNTDIDKFMCYVSHVRDWSSESCITNYCWIPCPEKCQCLVSKNRNVVIVDCTSLNTSSVNETIPPPVTTLYLDGNNFSRVGYRMFPNLHFLKELYINASGIAEIEDDTFQDLDVIDKIFLQDNTITVISPRLFINLTTLQYINLENNLINNIAEQSFLGTSLKILRLAYNKLSYLTFDPRRINHIKVLTLSKNPWSCDCVDLQALQEMTYDLADIIVDRRNMICRLNDTLNSSYPIGSEQHVIELDYHSLCPNITLNFTTIQKYSSIVDKGMKNAFIAVFVVLVLIVVTAIAVFANRELIQVIVYNRFGLRFSQDNTDDDKTFDAFVSYSHIDEGYVVHELVQRLENQEGFQLCVHFRDFPVGACIADTIVNSVQNSRRTIIVLSNNFLDSEWCQYEFQTAHHSVLKEKERKIIMILMEDIDQTKLDANLKLYLKSRTYLKRDDPWFWEKIIYSMPDRHKEQTVPGFTALNDLNIDDNDVIFRGKKTLKYQQNIV